MPLIVRWPGKVQSGSESDARVTHLDFFPTLMEAANILVDPDHVLDGESLAPILTGQSELKRDSIYFHYPNYAWHARNRLGSVIIEGDYKLLSWFDDDSVELYDLSKDPGETSDLSAQRPELSARLNKKLKNWLKNVDANLPVENPDYDPSRS